MSEPVAQPPITNSLTNIKRTLNSEEDIDVTDESTKTKINTEFAKFIKTETYKKLLVTEPQPLNFYFTKHEIYLIKGEEYHPISQIAKINSLAHEIKEIRDISRAIVGSAAESATGILRQEPPTHQRSPLTLSSAVATAIIVDQITPPLISLLAENSALNLRHEKAQSIMAVASNLIESLVSQLAQRKDDLSSIEKQCDGMHTALNASNQKLAELTGNLTALRAEFSSSTDENSALTDAITANEAALTTALQLNSSLTSELDELRIELASQQAEAAAATSSHTSQIAAISSDLAESQSTNAALNTTLAALKTQLRASEALRLEQTSLNSTLKERITLVNSQLEDGTERTQQLKSELQSLRLENENLRSQIVELESSVRSQFAAESTLSSELSKIENALGLEPGTQDPATRLAIIKGKVTADNTELTAALSTSESLSTHLRETLAAKDVEINQIKLELSESGATNTALRDKLVQMISEHAAARDIFEAVKTELDTLNATQKSALTELAQKMQANVKELQEAQTGHSQLRTTVLDQAAQLEKFTKTSEDLIAAKARILELEALQAITESTIISRQSEFETLQNQITKALDKAKTSPITDADLTALEESGGSDLTSAFKALYLEITRLTSEHAASGARNEALVAAHQEFDSLNRSLLASQEEALKKATLSIKALRGEPIETPEGRNPLLFAIETLADRAQAQKTIVIDLSRQLDEAKFQHETELERLQALLDESSTAGLAVVENLASAQSELTSIRDALESKIRECSQLSEKLALLNKEKSEEEDHYQLELAQIGNTLGMEKDFPTKSDITDHIKRLKETLSRQLAWIDYQTTLIAKQEAAIYNLESDQESAIKYNRSLESKILSLEQNLFQSKAGLNLLALSSKKENADLRSQLEEREQALATLQATHESETSTLRADVEEKKAALTMLNAQLAEAKASFESARVSIIEYQATLEKANADNTRLSTELTKATSDLTILRMAYKHVQEEHAKAQLTGKANTEQLAGLRAEAAEINVKFDAKKRKIANLKNTIIANEATIKALTAENITLKDRVSELEGLTANQAAKIDKQALKLEYQTTAIEASLAERSIKRLKIGNSDPISIESDFINLDEIMPPAEIITPSEAETPMSYLPLVDEILVLLREMRGPEKEACEVIELSEDKIEKFNLDQWFATGQIKCVHKNGATHFVMSNAVIMKLCPAKELQVLWGIRQISEREKRSLKAKKITDADYEIIYPAPPGSKRPKQLDSHTLIGRASRDYFSPMASHIKAHQSLKAGTDLEGSLDSFNLKCIEIKTQLLEHKSEIVKSRERLLEELAFAQVQYAGAIALSDLANIDKYNGIISKLNTKLKNLNRPAKVLIDSLLNSPVPICRNLIMNRVCLPQEPQMKAIALLFNDVFSHASAIETTDSLDAASGAAMRPWK